MCYPRLDHEILINTVKRIFLKKATMAISSFTLKRNLIVDLLSIVFGLGSWIAMTGLWVELPVLVQRLPEGWALPSSLSLILQVANIGVVIYGVGNRLWPRVVTEVTATHGQMIIGTVSSLLLIFFWSSTAPIGGEEHSVWLFVFSFGLSIVDCTSSVVFLPYMFRFREIYLVPYLAGEGLSGFLPSLLAMAQGIEQVECRNMSVLNTSADGANITEYQLVPYVPDPRFSPEMFFLFLLIMVVVSWVAFILLNHLPLAKKEQISHKSQNKQSNKKTETSALYIKQKLKRSSNEVKLTSTDYQQNQTQETVVLNPSGKAAHDGNLDTRAESENSVDVVIREGKNRALYLWLLFLQLWACITTFGVFPAIQSYSCLPYGSDPYHLAVTLSGVAYPAACIFAMFVEWKSVRGVSLLSALATVIAVYLMTTAVMSPFPPLVGTKEGATIIIISWVLFTSIFSYVKTMVTVLLRDIGHDALFWCGAVTQVGAVVGALLMFLLVNFTEIFQDDNSCGV